MSRGQATTEYVALMLCIVLGVCLLVRTITPLEGLGMSLVHVFVPKRHPAPPKHPRKPPAQRRAPRRTPRCYCPLGPSPPASASAVSGSSNRSRETRKAANATTSPTARPIAPQAARAGPTRLDVLEQALADRPLGLGEV
jgi:hypothetical protein